MLLTCQEAQMKVEPPQMFFTQRIFYFWFCSENEGAEVAEF